MGRNIVDAHRSVNRFEINPVLIDPDTVFSFWPRVYYERRKFDPVLFCLCVKPTYSMWRATGVG